MSGHAGVGLSPAAGSTRLRFSETLRGHIAFGEPDFRQAARVGRREGNRLQCRLALRIPDVDRFLGDPAHAAEVGGWIDCAALGGRLGIVDGVFSVAAERRDPIQLRVRYRLLFSDGCDHLVTLRGYKVVRDDPGLDLWSDTSTLYTRLVRGDVRAPSASAGGVIASGIVRLSPLGFLQQLASVRVQGGSLAGRVRTLWRALQLFTGSLWGVYGIELPGGDDQPA
jgi:cholesterol oxidase